MKLVEKFKAIKLRKAGFGYAQIFKKVKVSKSTLSYWLRDIELTSKQTEKLLMGRQKSQYAAAKSKRNQRIKTTQEIVMAGKAEFGTLVKNPLFLSGLLLYWAEGDKHRAEKVKFTNSDETMIILMMKWFREICNVPEDKFRVSLHVHDLHRNFNAKSYWSRLTGVSKKQFHKIYVKKSTLRQRRNVLYNGTCAVVVHNKELFRKIEGWKQGLVEYFNIRP